MKKKKELLLAVLGIIGVLVLTVGVTYSLLRYMREGSTENSITTGKITFLYTETSFGRGIKLENAMPLSDTDGKKQIGDRNVFDFKITADTTNNVAIPYDVTVVKQEGSDLEESDVKLYIAEVNANVEEYGKIGKFNDDSKFPKYNESNVERIIYKGKVPSNKEGYIQNLRLKMWISDDAEFSPLKDNDGNYIIENGEYKYPNNGKTFKVKVNVYATGGVITDTEVANESISSIEGISIGGTPLVESTTEDRLYETTLPEGTTETEVEVVTQNEYQKIKVEKTDSNYEPLTAMNNIGKIERMTATKKLTLPITAGENYFKLTVVSEDGTVNPDTYKLHITVENVRKLSDAIFETNQKPNGASDYIELDNDITSPNFAFNNTSAAKGQNGLYKSTATNSGNPTYYYRGAVENNYVNFAGNLWRIVRINEDGSIRLIMQDRINKNNGGNQSLMIHYNCNGINYMYYKKWENSSGYVKYELNKWYDDNIDTEITGMNKNYSSYLSTSTDGGYFCEEPKVAVDSSFSTGISGVNMQAYSNYTPNYQCKNVGTDPNVYGKLDIPVGLITYDEAIMAGGYYGISSDFYLNNEGGFFTMSPAGYSLNEGDIWYISYIGEILKQELDNPRRYARPVINLDKDVMVKGTGTAASPFTVIYTQ